MVESISPNYYAIGEFDGGYVLTGSGFNLIPNDAVGILAVHNNDPMQMINSTEVTHLYDIEMKTDSVMSLKAHVPVEHGALTYLGVIVSADRQTVYWVNNTNPLP